MLFPMFFVPFDEYLIVAVVGLTWLGRHRHWHRNATVRRLERIARRDRA